MLSIDCIPPGSFGAYPDKSCFATPAQRSFRWTGDGRTPGWGLTSQSYFEGVSLTGPVATGKLKTSESCVGLSICAFCFHGMTWHTEDGCVAPIIRDHHGKVTSARTCGCKAKSRNDKSFSPNPKSSCRDI